MKLGLKHAAVLAAKRALYGASGEPYPIAGATLRYTPGTRPVHVKYRHSANAVTRYDALQVEMISGMLGPGNFAIDVGAHAGQYALIMAYRCGPTGTVIAFEPDPHARVKLERNLALNPDVSRPVVESLALSDREGSDTLYSRGGDSNSSLSLSGLPSMAVEDLEQLDVAVATLDGYLRDRHLPAPDLVKIDTEGAEIRILRGAETVLASAAAILCELHPYAWEGFQTSFEDLKVLLDRFGRRMRYIDQESEAKGEAAYGCVLLER